MGRHKPRRHRRSVTRSEGTTATAVNESWGMDFMADQLFDGRRFRVLPLGPVGKRFILAIDDAIPLDERTHHASTRAHG